MSLQSALLYDIAQVSLHNACYLFILFHLVLIPIPFQKLTRLPHRWRSCLISSVTCSSFLGSGTCCLTDFPPVAQDGVLIRGDNALPAAKRALSILDGNNQFGMYVFFFRFAVLRAS